MFDPYSALGVSKNATQNEIKKTFRSLAKKYHPDLNPGNKEAEKKFKDISHAFDLIGTEEARAKFDRGELDQQEQANYEDFFRQQRGPFYSYTQSSPGGGRYSYSFHDDYGDEDLFESIFGKMRGAKRSGGFPGEDQLFQVEIGFNEAALGSERLITLPNGKKLQVKIPAGIEEGKRLRFKEQGSPGVNGAPSGDLYLEIKISPHVNFTRSGKDIETEVPISIFEAVNGAEIPVDTLDGRVMLKIPAGSSSGTKLRVKGKGAGAGEARGNLLVTLKVVAPKNPTPEMIEKFQNLEKQFQYNPRASV